jgi:hypothetical protein
MILWRTTMPEIEYYRGYHGSFYLLDTYGLPLSSSMDACAEKGMRVALDSFVFDAVKSGWTFDHAFSAVEEAVVEKFGERSEVSRKLPHFKDWLKGEISRGACAVEKK